MSRLPVVVYVGSQFKCSVHRTAVHKQTKKVKQTNGAQ